VYSGPVYRVLSPSLMNHEFCHQSQLYLIMNLTTAVLELGGSGVGGAGAGTGGEGLGGEGVDGVGASGHPFNSQIVVSSQSISAEILA